MCGIAGILTRDGSAPRREVLDRMIRLVRHRGPDAFGLAVDGPVGFAHARLSIIDLEGGVQPMASADGQLLLTFNGEIFNYIELREELIRKGHVFRTSSDTEVILHLYDEMGPDCVTRFNGQWAFAIWDARRQELFLSRDRIGVRPLFYSEQPGAFLFASEIKSLLAHPRVQRRDRPARARPALHVLGDAAAGDRRSAASMNCRPAIRCGWGATALPSGLTGRSTMLRPRRAAAPNPMPRSCSTCCSMRRASACAPTCRSAPISAAASIPP